MATNVGNTARKQAEAERRKAAHQEIALVYGDPAAKVTVPSTYAFGDS